MGAVQAEKAAAVQAATEEVAILRGRFAAACDAVEAAGREPCDGSAEWSARVAAYVELSSAVWRLIDAKDAARRAGVAL